MKTKIHFTHLLASCVAVPALNELPSRTDVFVVRSGRPRFAREHCGRKLNTAALIGLLLLLMSVAPAVFAQTTTIDWFTIDGGGGTSTGGVYTVSGTIGQPDAGTLTGGAYSLIGGFWSVLAAETPGPPFLRIVYGEGMVVLSWPNPSTGFQLQETPSLLGPMMLWTDVGQAPSVVNGEKQVILPLTPDDRFFRLRKP